MQNKSYKVIKSAPYFLKYMSQFINERESIATFCVYLDGKIKDTGDSFVFYWFVVKLHNVCISFTFSKKEKKKKKDYWKSITEWSDRKYKR